MPRPVAYCGPHRTILYAVCANRTSPGLEFYNQREPRVQAQLNALFQRLGDFGTILNEEKFKKIENTEFFEFKAFRVRMPCFMLPDGLVVITHGFIKKREKIGPTEIERAKRIKAEDEGVFTGATRASRQG